MEKNLSIMSNQDESSAEENELYGEELEKQFIIRFPKDLAEEAAAYIEDDTIDKKLWILFDEENDHRYALVRLNEHKLYGKLVDLPTILECHKTVDKTNLYKTADICQMLVCTREPPKGKKLTDKYLWPHGVTPPCRNLRFWRLSTLKRKTSKIPKHIRDVKMLLARDLQAEGGGTFSLIDDDGMPEGCMFPELLGVPDSDGEENDYSSDESRNDFFDVMAEKI